MNNNSRFLCLMFLLTSFSLLAQPKVNPNDIGQKWLNISYAGDTLKSHLLDIYLPAKGKAPYPVIVAIAGSAWFSGNSKTRAFEIASSLLSQGFAIVAINHRSSRKAIFPAQVNDVKGAIRFIRANARKYQLNTSFLGIMGDSSGGHLSTFAATSGGVTNYTIGSKTVAIEGNVGGNLNQSSRVDAVVDWYGPTIFQKMDSCGSQFSHNEINSPESTLIGGLIQENNDLCALANPINDVIRGVTPTVTKQNLDDILRKVRRKFPPCKMIILGMDSPDPIRAERVYALSSPAESPVFRI